MRVGFVLTGSVRRAGDRLRLSAQLSRVADDSLLWSETYERKVADVFEVQDDLSRRITGTVREALGTSSATTPARIQPARYNVARWVTSETGDGAAADERELKRFIDGNAHRVALDAVDAPCVMLEYAGELRAMQDNWPKIRFHAMREHAGLVFQKQG